MDLSPKMVPALRLSPHALGLCALALITAAITTGCAQDVTMSLPPQAVPHPYFARVHLDMTPRQPAPWGASINSGVDPPDPKLNWRWITTSSTYSFQLEDRPDWQFDLHLTAVDYVLKALGPQTVTVLMNGSEVSKLVLDKAGPFFAHVAVHPGSKPQLELRIAPCDPRPDREPYCALLHSIGFSRELH
jgi:hypothetical protein